MQQGRRLLPGDGPFPARVSLTGPIRGLLDSEAVAMYADPAALAAFEAIENDALRKQAEVVELARRVNIALAAIRAEYASDDRIVDVKTRAAALVSVPPIRPRPQP